MDKKNKIVFIGGDGYSAFNFLSKMLNLKNEDQLLYYHQYDVFKHTVSLDVIDGYTDNTAIIVSGLSESPEADFILSEAKSLKRTGYRTTAIYYMPFQWEGPGRLKNASDMILKSAEFIDLRIPLYKQKLYSIMLNDNSVEDAMKMIWLNTYYIIQLIRNLKLFSDEAMPYGVGSFGVGENANAYSLKSAYHKVLSYPMIKAVLPNDIRHLIVQLDLADTYNSEIHPSYYMIDKIFSKPNNILYHYALRNSDSNINRVSMLVVSEE